MTAKRRPGSSARGRRARKNVLHVPDSAIDFSDIPPLSREQLAAMRRVGRPPIGGATKRPIAFRINPNLLQHLRRLAADRGKSYQTLMHDLLEKAVAESQG
ncbi:MAG TPA: BrnA antitoxin family protein [Gemmatimonadaceae bacterium]|nr:BrnA antitoxin family protein [Gemmatimonadaceae bacterium]